MCADEVCGDIRTALGLTTVPGRELWIGSRVLTVLRVPGAYLCGLIRDQGDVAVTVVQVPPATALMALFMWLPFRGTQKGPGTVG